MVKKILMGLVLICSQLNAVINLNDSRIDKRALFYKAIEQANIDLAKTLIKSGLNVNNGQYLSKALDCYFNPYYCRDCGENSLDIKKKYNDIIKLLLNAGCNVNSMSYDDCTQRCIELLPFKRLLDYDQWDSEIIELLINTGTNFNLNDDLGCSAIFLLAWYGYDAHVEPYIKLLQSNGADMNVKNNYGKTPLDYAIEGGRLEVVKALIRVGAKINEVDLDLINSLIKISAQSQQLTEIIKLLLDYSVNLQIKDNTGKTLLENAFKQACTLGNLEAIEFLQSL
jgi:ankyrin repeat protein